MNSKNVVKTILNLFLHQDNFKNHAVIFIFLSFTLDLFNCFALNKKSYLFTLGEKKSKHEFRFYHYDLLFYYSLIAI